MQILNFDDHLLMQILNFADHLLMQTPSDVYRLLSMITFWCKYSQIFIVYFRCSPCTPNWYAAFPPSHCLPLSPLAGSEEKDQAKHAGWWLVGEFWSPCKWSLQSSSSSPLLLLDLPIKVVRAKGSGQDTGKSSTAGDCLGRHRAIQLRYPRVDLLLALLIAQPAEPRIIQSQSLATGSSSLSQLDSSRG